MMEAPRGEWEKDNGDQVWSELIVSPLFMTQEICEEKKNSSLVFPFASEGFQGSSITAHSVTLPTALLGLWK